MSGDHSEEDLSEFIGADEVSPPNALSRILSERIAAELNPPPSGVFMKLALVVALAGSATLLICPQFGLGTSVGIDLMRYFMRFGHAFCQVACGVIFIGTSFLVTSFILRPEELKVLRENRFLQVAAVSGLSLAAFICFGTGTYFSMTLLWFLGAMFGGLACFEAGYTVRRRLILAGYTVLA